MIGEIEEGHWRRSCISEEKQFVGVNGFERFGGEADGDRAGTDRCAS